MTWRLKIGRKVYRVRWRGWRLLDGQAERPVKAGNVIDLQEYRRRLAAAAVPRPEGAA